jgi:hypothetical protein
MHAQLRYLLTLFPFSPLEVQNVRARVQRFLSNEEDT